MKLTLDTKGNEKQKLAAGYWKDSTTEQILYGGAKYGGKSFLGCSLIFADALKYKNTRYFIARKSLTDLRRYTAPSIYEVFGKWKLNPNEYMRYDGKDNYYRLHNKSVVEFVDASYSPQDPDYHRFGSRQYTRGWCEEIGDMDDAAIRNLLLATGRWRNRESGIVKKLLLTCNPYKGLGYQEFYKPNKEGILAPNKKFVLALPTDNKSGDPEYIRSLLEHPNENERQRLAFGNWEFDNDPSILIDYKKILDLFTNEHVPTGDKYITADIARLGGDRIVIILWSGMRGKVIAYDRQKLNVTTTNLEAARIRHAVGKSGVLVDSDGLGSGVEDFGGYKGFVNNAKALPDPKKPHEGPENYDNIKSQCGFRAAEIINANGMYLEVEDWMKPLIIQELEHVKQKILDSDMKKGLLSKQKVKEAIGRSPDFWDAILMRMWFELKPKFVVTADSI